MYLQTLGTKILASGSRLFGFSKYRRSPFWYNTNHSFFHLFKIEPVKIKRKNMCIGLFQIITKVFKHKILIESWARTVRVQYTTTSWFTYSVSTASQPWLSPMMPWSEIRSKQAFSNWIQKRFWLDWINNNSVYNAKGDNPIYIYYHHHVLNDWASELRR